jgi:hypothetical protein
MTDALEFHMEAAYGIASRRLIEAASAEAAAFAALEEKESAFRPDIRASAEAVAAFRRAYSAAAAVAMEASELKQAVVAARIKACAFYCGGSGSDFAFFQREFFF